MVLGVPLVIYAMAKFGLLGAPRGSVQVPLAAIHANPWLYGTQLLIGLGCSVFGGYVAAWIAKHDELLNELAVFLSMSRDRILFAGGWQDFKLSDRADFAFDRLSILWFAWRLS
jgi:hypothetical protein